MARPTPTPAPAPPPVEDHQGERPGGLSALFGNAGDPLPPCITQGHAQAPDSVKAHDAALHDELKALEVRLQNLRDDNLRLQNRAAPMEAMVARFEDLRRDLVARNESRRSLGLKPSATFEQWQADVTRAIQGG